MKRVVLCPSNQDRNVGLYPGGLSEASVCLQIAERVERLSRSAGISATVIVPQPESADRYRHQGLIRQLDDAVKTLDAGGVDPADGAILNIHTDSGAAQQPDFPHVFGCYGGGPDEPSRRLVELVGLEVHSLMGGPFRLLDYTAYLFWQRRSGYVSGLVELGCHQSPANVDVLLHRQEEIAEGVVRGLMVYFGLAQRVSPAAPAHDDAAYFSTFGVPYNPDAAIARYWRACRAAGDLANLGPAIGPEEDGTPYGEPGHIVQRFANAIVVCHPEHDWACYRAQVVLEPERWFPELA